MNGLDITEQKVLAEREDDGAEVHIHGIDDMPLYYTNNEGDEVAVTITVAGTNSRKFREIESRQRKRRIKPRDLTGSRLHEDGIEKVAFCTIRWQGILNNGEEVRCDFENARVLYREVPHVYNQLVEAMGEAERFFDQTSTT